MRVFGGYQPLTSRWALSASEPSVGVGAPGNAEPQLGASMNSQKPKPNNPSPLTQMPLTQMPLTQMPLTQMPLPSPPLAARTLISRPDDPRRSRAG
jgi:hypothetical protein